MRRSSPSTLTRAPSLPSSSASPEHLGLPNKEDVSCAGPGLEELQALWAGMREKASEFRAAGSQVYVKQ